MHFSLGRENSLLVVSVMHLRGRGMDLGRCGKRKGAFYLSFEKTPKRGDAFVSPERGRGSVSAITSSLERIIIFLGMSRDGLQSDPPAKREGSTNVLGDSPPARGRRSSLRGKREISLKKKG